MDRKSILIVASLLVMSANAQLKTTDATLKMSPAIVKHKHSVVNSKKAMKQLDYVQKPQALMQEMHPASANPTFVTNAPEKANNYVNVYWIRPAGLFPGFEVMKNGTDAGGYYMPLYFAKPFADYEFWGVAEGADEDFKFLWEYTKSVLTEDGWESQTFYYQGNPLVVNYVWGDENEVPKLFGSTDENFINDVYTYQPGGYEMSGTSDKPVAGDFHVSYIESTPSAFDFYEEEGTDLMVSSKTFCSGGRHADQRYIMTYYSGCNPYPGNESGWWFGKNGGRANGMPVDGIAQAFEKPQHPYLLKQVVINTAVLEVTGPVDMTCRVYKLDAIPDYDPERAVALREEDFGEQIAYGRASLTPETNDVTGGLIIFTLYSEEDGMEYEITPTIEDAIIICIDGYNDEGMENLKDWSACISSDDLVNEGYGELAYIKYGLSDDDGNFSGEYVWAGLNNFFTSGTMMTGMSIFITVDNPFLIYNYSLEDGEYTFPIEGGLMEKTIYEDENETIVTRSIEFFSYTPSVDEGWTLTCNGDDVPDWLSIELTDGEENGEFDNFVNAEVTAEPLPEGVAYREAVVRFGCPGAYLDYKFRQGEKAHLPCGPSSDGEINIGDLNYLIKLILEDMYDNCYDINEDGELNIGDINALINIILL